ELHGAAHRAGDHVVLERHPRSRRPRLPRPRRDAADAGMGDEARRRARVHHPRAVGGGPARHRHPAHGARPQPRRRRPPRRPRPEDAEQLRMLRVLARFDAAIRPVFQFYRQVALIEKFAGELKTDRFYALDLDRKEAMTLDYLRMVHNAVKLGDPARAALAESLGVGVRDSPTMPERPLSRT